jgi:hypothetical protein
VILAYNIPNQKQLTGIVSLIKEMSEKLTPIIHSTHCINKAFLCSGNNGDLGDVTKFLTFLVDKLK